MICEKCGKWIEDGSKACSSCGAPVNVDNAQNSNAASAGSTGNAAPDGGQPGSGSFNTGAAQPGSGAVQMPAGVGSFNGNAGQGGQAPMTKEAFYKHPNIANVRSQIRSSGIICYVVAGITLVLQTLAGNPFGALLDVLLIVGLGLGIQLGKSRVCAIILTAYGALNTIMVTLQQGRLGGWWILLAGIYAVIYTFKYQSAWAEYQKTGNIRDFSTPGKKNK